MSDEFKPHEMNPEMAAIIAERLLEAHKVKGCLTANVYEAFKAGAVAALMARVRIDGVDWVNPPGAVGMTGITDNPYGAEIVAKHGSCGKEEDV